jgi:hypothetical protein
VHRLPKEILPKRDRHRTSTKFRFGVIRWVHEHFKRLSYINIHFNVRRIWQQTKEKTLSNLCFSTLLFILHTAQAASRYLRTHGKVRRTFLLPGRESWFSGWIRSYRPSQKWSRCYMNIGMNGDAPFCSWAPRQILVREPCMSIRTALLWNTFRCHIISRQLYNEFKNISNNEVYVLRRILKIIIRGELEAPYNKERYVFKMYVNYNFEHQLIYLMTD